MRESPQPLGQRADAAASGALASYTYDGFERRLHVRPKRRSPGFPQFNVRQRGFGIDHQRTIAEA